MKKFISAVLVLCILLSLSACKVQEQSLTKYTAHYFDFFDTATTVVGYAKSQSEFNSVCAEIKNMLEEYHSLYDIYLTYDGVVNLAVVNSKAHEAPIEVDKKIIDLLIYSKEMYELTNSKINVAMGSVLSIWHDYRTIGVALPSMDKLKEASLHTDINNLVIDADNSTVFLKDEKMTLDVGAIAKGYAVEQIARHLKEKGITGYLLNVGGNIQALGSKGDGTPWTVGIENPGISTDENYIAYLEFTTRAIVTSGSYQRYYTVDGVNYHHIIDPITLMPGVNYKSVSVLCENSALGDALSTSLFLMDIEDGQKLISGLDNVEAMWVLPSGEIKYSKEFQNYTIDKVK